MHRPSNGFTSTVNTLELTTDGVCLLDQTLLPTRLEYRLIQTAADMAEAIRTMIVRGAPAIGIAGAYGLVLSARQHASLNLESLKARLKTDAEMLRATRPTAVNLAWALDQMLALVETAADRGALLEQLTELATQIHREDLEACYRMGDYGAQLVPKGARILTHCNAGALATAGYGTALGVIRSAFAVDPTVQVYADETRPRLQGAKLTAWELQQDQIPVTLVADNMSGILMKNGKVDMVVVGADRIAANGDTANKIGTYNLALVAHAHGVPFYVAAPCSTIDISIPNGEAIPIEERDPEELYAVGQEQIAPTGIGFYNPAFDVTPSKYITAIITEKGIVRPPFTEGLAQLFQA